MTKPSSPPDPGVAFQVLPLALLLESPLNTRRHWPADSQAELERSIAKSGILTPLLVRPIEPETPDGPRYEIAAGHRRFRAAKKRKLTHVPALVRPMTTAELKEIIAVENLQREDLHPLDEAAGLAQLLEGDRSVAAIEGVAARLGKSVSYVYQRLKLLELDPVIQEAFLADQLTAGHAILLARLDPVQQRAMFKDHLKPHSHRPETPSVRFLADSIARQAHLLSQAPFKTADKDLVPAAGACTTCPKRSDHQSELFAGVASIETAGRRGPRCLDPVCWAGKVTAKIERAKAELAEKTGAPPVSVAVGYIPYGEKLPEGVVAPMAWVEVPKKEKGAVPAVVVAGQSSEHTLGDTVYVKLGKARRRVSVTEAAARKREAAATAKRRKFLALTVALQTRLVGKLAVGATVRPLLVVAVQAVVDIMDIGDAEAVNAFEEATGLPTGGIARDKWLKAAKPAKLLQVLQAAALFDDRATMSSSDRLAPWLVEAAKALKVDPQKVAKELEAPPK